MRKPRWINAKDQGEVTILRLEVRVNRREWALMAEQAQLNGETVRDVAIGCFSEGLLDLEMRGVERLDPEDADEQLG